ncbi:putative bifunctional diguanylate cyclase/phosphodiesterase [Calderihabitans maritimus]|uniref:Diguanylate cyclase/phosphodiesterase n=1 Tax=Calderihabitans maritimus TaxID=1246530 RepID=A0A1Z5HPB8_9FIRM|nr:bifunctional diguanylate cyclase/phosphodiesterase [Calderihabitans maritimus]GAW91372.1 diguanylate cyclase/phosphodiesterase [Calderihabitans maritimus]
MWFSKGMLELVQELTSQAEQLSLVGEEVTERVVQAYADRLRALLERVRQETSETELRGAASDFLALFAGSHNEELLRRRIEFGRKLGAAEVSLEQLVTAYGFLFGRWCDELVPVLPFPERELQSLKYGGTSLLLDLGLLLLGYEGEVARQMRMVSEVDVLTGLLSRRKFEKELQEALEFARRTKREFSLCWIDIDNFKLVNDVYGYTVGDIVLKAVADFLREAVSDAFAIARIGGNEYGVILMDTGPAEALAKAQELCRGMAALKVRPLGDEIFITGSIGVASYPHHGEALADLMCAAEVAQVMAKRTGKNRALLVDAAGESTNPTVVHERILLLREALRSEGAIVPFYQPIVDLETGRPVGYEVLARVRRGEKYLPAGLFVEAAEQFGLMGEVGRIVIEQALQEKKNSWAEDMLFFINFSMREVESGGTPQFLADLLRRYGIRPEEIVAEITERQAVRDMHAVQAFARDMADLGVRLAVDDFGSGFSSFLYLRYFDCYFAKIEGSLVREITRSGRCRMIVENMVSLLQGLSVEVVAEYVESREAVEILRRAGVRYGQGYYLGMPSRFPCNGE